MSVTNGKTAVSILCCINDTLYQAKFTFEVHNFLLLVDDSLRQCLLHIDCKQLEQQGGCTIGQSQCAHIMYHLHIYRHIIDRHYSHLQLHMGGHWDKLQAGSKEDNRRK